MQLRRAAFRDLPRLACGLCCEPYALGETSWKCGRSDWIRWAVISEIGFGNGSLKWPLMAAAWEPDCAPVVVGEARYNFEAGL